VKKARVAAIEYYLPEEVLTTSQLAEEFPEWSVEKIDAMTGIERRHIAAPGQCASDLAVEAARRLFDSGACAPDEVDYLLLCTQCPDYPLPATACLLHDRLGLPAHAGALDFSIGSSGYVYGLGLAQGLIETGQAGSVLLITADTYSRYVNRRDRSVRPVFGDAAAVTLLTAVEREDALMGPYVYGADGKGAPHLIVPAGGMREPRSPATALEQADAGGAIRSRQDLFMDGSEIFAFTLRVVPPLVARLLERAGLEASAIDLFVFHQANRYMLEHLRKRLRIPPEKFVIAMQWGNTASSSIPLALKSAMSEGRLADGARVVLAGYGPGYSWGAVLVRWEAA
jgi:3-oxoacyl-[acyl-carrier-protein] synthase-3